MAENSSSAHRNIEGLFVDGGIHAHFKDHRLIDEDLTARLRVRPIEVSGEASLGTPPSTHSA